MPPTSPSATGESPRSINAYNSANSREPLLSPSRTPNTARIIGSGALCPVIADNAVRNLIREDKIAQLYSVMQTSQSRQMHTLEQNVQKLVNDGQIRVEIAKQCSFKQL